MKSFSNVVLFGSLTTLISAMTPAGLTPASSENMTVYFDTTTLAVNGVNIPRANTAPIPNLALDKSLSGATFAVVMTDPDAGGPSDGSSSFLHWLQDNLTTSNTSLTIAGKTVFPLLNTSNTTAKAAYFQPTPPKGSVHRYTQYLVATNGLNNFNNVSAAVAKQLATRIQFNMQAYVREANLTIVSANYFNVTGV